MGKKSKSKSTKSPQCFHGCITKKDFNFGGHYKILEGWDNTVDVDEFIKTNKCYLVDPTFGCFVIAHITDDFLKGKDDDTLLHRLILLVDIRYFYIPRHEGKDVDSPESKYNIDNNKYRRDIKTERGRINCMAREIPCGCMDEKKKEAKLMAKVAVCFECEQTFSKEKMLRCKGCDYNQYCSNECSIKDWPYHKEWCKRNSVSSASASAT